LSDSVPTTIIYVKERKKNDNNKERFEDACKMVGYYRNRWKIERFHYVLKSGCTVEKIQERTADKMIMLLFMYSIIASFIMNLTYIARINPDLPCCAV
jgi:hypothetical protein